MTGEGTKSQLPEVEDKPPLPPIVAAKSLFGEVKEIRIEHEGEFYRLRITRKGRLILSK